MINYILYSQVDWPIKHSWFGVHQLPMKEGSALCCVYSSAINTQYPTAVSVIQGWEGERYPWWCLPHIPGLSATSRAHHNESRADPNPGHTHIQSKCHSTHVLLTTKAEWEAEPPKGFCRYTLSHTRKSTERMNKSCMCNHINQHLTNNLNLRNKGRNTWNVNFTSKHVLQTKGWVRGKTPGGVLSLHPVLHITELKINRETEQVLHA